MSVLSRTDHRAPHARRIAVLILGVVFAVALAAGASAVVFGLRTAFVIPYTPDSADGVLAESVSLDADVPAITEIDPALRAAVEEASDAAGADGIRFEITSGWRSRAYQEWLLDDAIATYGSEELAREYVSSPDDSHHVTGLAIDIGPLDAQLWLTEHGATWGLCQTYANERWHYELATSPGGVCPEPQENAAG